MHPMTRNFFSLIIFSLISRLALAQSNTDTTKSKYIEQFPDKFFIWPVVKKRSLSFDITNRNNRNQNLSYKPNSSFSAGVGVYLFEVAVEITVAIPINEKSKGTYGSSDVRDLRANIFGKAWGLDVFTQRYKGFYVPDRSTSTKNSFVKRPDIELRNTGINGLYIFNTDRFSLRAAYNYKERQLKSGGSVVVAGNLNTFQVTSDSAIVEKRNAPFFTATSTFKNMRYTTLSLAGGYTHTFVYRSFYLSGALSIGPAHHWLAYETPTKATNYTISINTFTDVRVAIGYNSERFFGGMSLVAQSRNIRFEDILFASSSSSVKLVFGYRFEEAGILKKRARDYVPGNHIQQ